MVPPPQPLTPSAAYGHQSIAAQPVLSSNCEQCHVVSWRKKLNTDLPFLFPSWISVLDFLMHLKNIDILYGSCLTVLYVLIWVQGIKSKVVSLGLIFCAVMHVVFAAIIQVQQWSDITAFIIIIVICADRQRCRRHSWESGKCEHRQRSRASWSEWPHFSEHKHVCYSHWHHISCLYFLHCRLTIFDNGKCCWTA